MNESLPLTGAADAGLSGVVGELGRDAPLTKTLLIVYHTMTGGTLQMAQAAASGARSEGTVDVRLLHARDAGPDDVLAADGLIFATPENLAAMSGMLKDFFDRSYYAVLDRINGRPYALLICAGGRRECRAVRAKHKTIVASEQSDRG